MKILKYSFLIIGMAILFSACKKRKKFTVSSFELEQIYGNVIFTYSSDHSPIYYEISYLQDGTDGNDPDKGGKHILSEENSESVSQNTLKISSGVNYSFWIRAFEDEKHYGPWFGPKKLNMSNYCESPTDLSVYATKYSIDVSWEEGGYSTETSYYQMQYGMAGFELGSGETITCNDPYTRDAELNTGNVYDFYVRGFCEDGLGWSQWTGPVSHFAENNHNLCHPPFNLSYEVEYFDGSPSGAVFKWNPNGEDKFEFTIVSDGASVESGTISSFYYTDGNPYYSLSEDTDYDFYVRGVCKDENKTDWAGPLNVNIGG